MSGREPRWRGDGKELFWIEAIPGTTRTKLMAAAIGQAPNPVGKPQALFEFQSLLFLPGVILANFGPLAHGRRHKIARSDSARLYSGGG